MLVDIKVGYQILQWLFNSVRKDGVRMSVIVQRESGKKGALDDSIKNMNIPSWPPALSLTFLMLYYEPIFEFYDIFYQIYLSDVTLSLFKIMLYIFMVFFSFYNENGSQGGDGACL